MWRKTHQRCTAYSSPRVTAAPDGLRARLLLLLDLTHHEALQHEDEHGHEDADEPPLEAAERGTRPRALTRRVPPAPLRCGRGARTRCRRPRRATTTRPRGRPGSPRSTRPGDTEHDRRDRGHRAPRPASPSPRSDVAIAAPAIASAATATPDQWCMLDVRIGRGAVLELRVRDGVDPGGDHARGARRSSAGCSGGRGAAAGIAGRDAAPPGRRGRRRPVM